MDISARPDAPLADLYRQARALASADTASPEEALSFSQTSTAAFADIAEEERGAGGPEGRRRDQVRRAAIAALRHQALLLRQAWVAGDGPSAEVAAGVPALLAQATALAEAALALHREGDAGRRETEYIVRFLRSTAAIAAVPARRPQAVEGVPPPDAQEGATPPGTQPAEPQTTVREEPPVHAAEPSVAGGAAPPSLSPRRPSGVVRRLRPQLVAALAAVAVVGFAASVVTGPHRIPRQMGGPMPSSSPAVAVSPHPGGEPAPPSASPGAPRVPVPSAAPAAASPAAPPLPAPAVAPHPAPARPSAGPAQTPPPARPTVALLLRSQPGGAQVYVGTTLKGTTPLRLFAPPGTVLAVTVRRGPRIWRGTLRLGDGPTQAVTVSLPAPTAQAAPPRVRASPRPTPVTTPVAAPTGPRTTSRQAHYEALMARGLELYSGGWYGPAMGQFKQAAAVMPTPRAYLWIGRAAFRGGRFAEARRALERVLELAPGTEAAREAQMLLNRLRSAGPGGQS